MSPVTHNYDGNGAMGESQKFLDARVATLERQQPDEEEDKGAFYKLTYIFLHLIQLIVSLAATLKLFIYKDVLEFTAECNDEGRDTYTIKADIGYPLSLESISPMQDLCYGNRIALQLQGNYSMYCQFFVGVGILSTITALVMFLKALLALRKELSLRGWMCYLDVVVSIVFLVLWVVNSAVLVQAVIGYTADTQFDVVKEINGYICISYPCHPGQTPNPFKLWVAVGFGFLCVLLYLVNVAILLVEKRRQLCQFIRLEEMIKNCTKMQG